jgi:diguanylate cyclase (GGDEF)-like protein
VTGVLRKIPGVIGSHGYLVDARDTVIASTDPARPVGSVLRQPGHSRALGGTLGDHAGYYDTQVPIPNSTWKLVLVAPDSALFASLSGVRKWWPWLLAFALVAVAAFLLGRWAERQLRHDNARLAHDALHDSLTGLANRALFMDRLAQTLQRSTRDDTAGCAVLFLDANGFKQINDSLTHAIGDQLLIALARHLEAEVRPGDTVARIGGDEFTVLLENITSANEATTVAERITSALGRAITIGDHQLVVTASIGIAFSSQTITPAGLLRNADTAMYDAKRRGTSYAIFNHNRHSTDHAALSG